MSTGDLVGDPDLVIREISYEHGSIPPIGAGPRAIPVVPQRFRQVRHTSKPGDRQYVRAAWRRFCGFRDFDCPGLMFDRGRAVELTPRRELLELVPAPDAPAKPATSEAA